MNFLCTRKLLQIKMTLFLVLRVAWPGMRGRGSDDFVAHKMASDGKDAAPISKPAWRLDAMSGFSGSGQ